MVPALLALALAATPFPLPAIDGKPLAITEGQKSFRLPMRFEKVKAFYEEQFKDQKGVTVRVSGTTGTRLLALESSRATDNWKSAKVKEGELETVVELKEVMRLAGDVIEGKAPPVQFILTRSAEVEKSLQTIDHTETMKAR
jgi:hypothetical protein